MDLKQFIIQLVTMSGVVGIITAAVCKSISNKVKATAERIKAAKEDDECIKLAIQAILRNMLYELHDKWFVKKGYVPIPVKENFANMYERYHNLGANGVMDKIREEFMAAPTQPRTQGGGMDDCETKTCQTDRC